MFNRLKRDNMDNLLSIRLAELQTRLGSHKVKIEVSKEAREWLCDSGYNPSYGARPLNRVIKTHVLDPLSRAILSGAVRDEEVVKVDLRDNKIHVVHNHAVEDDPSGFADADDDEQ